MPPVKRKTPGALDCGCKGSIQLFNTKLLNRIASIVDVAIRPIVTFVVSDSCSLFVKSSVLSERMPDKPGRH